MEEKSDAGTETRAYRTNMVAGLPLPFLQKESDSQKALG